MTLDGKSARGRGHCYGNRCWWQSASRGREIEGRRLRGERSPAILQIARLVTLQPFVLVFAVLQVLRDLLAFFAIAVATVDPSGVRGIRPRDFARHDLRAGHVAGNGRHGDEDQMTIWSDTTQHRAQHRTCLQIDAWHLVGRLDSGILGLQVEPCDRGLHHLERRTTHRCIGRAKDVVPIDDVRHRARETRWIQRSLDAQTERRHERIGVEASLRVPEAELLRREQIAFHHVASHAHDLLSGPRRRRLRAGDGRNGPPCRRARGAVR
jgi:hypothetical protein